MSRPRFLFVTSLTASLLFARTAVAGINFIGGELTSVAPEPEYMLAGDLTNDGLTDIVVFSPPSKEVDVFVANTHSASHVAAAQTLHFGNQLRGPALGDLNADGHLDLVVTDAGANVVWVLLGTGGGTFDDPYQVTVGNALAPTSVTIGNFDDSGNADLAVVDARLGRVFVLLNDDGTPPCFTPGGDFAAGSEPSQISTGDFNGDGKPDLATLNLGGPRVKDVSIVLWSRVTRGFPEFQPPMTHTVGAQPSDMVLADFNNDNRPDIAMINQAAGGAAGTIDVLMNEGTGVFSSPTATQVPCPFFTGGAPCRLWTLVAGDFDGNGFVDLMVGLSDPRRFNGSSSSPHDAMEAFGGRGDGRFVAGPVFPIQKSPVAMAAGIITGSGKVDLAVVDESTLSLQAFVNVSQPGEHANGDPCLLGDECLSSRCTNGVCCAAQCNLDEQCNVPGREGTCVPLLPEPVPCTLPDQPECAQDQFCVDGFCCDAPCVGGHCNRPGFLGVCIPGIPDGQPCSDDSTECSSGFCSPNLICCREACDGGFCDSDGVCHPRIPNGDLCQADAECQSDVCDVYDLICCNRRCNYVAEKCSKGTCVILDFAPTSTPLLEPTPPASNPCGSCPSGTHRNNGLCVATNSSSGCSTVDGDPAGGNLSVIAVLPLALWMARCWQFRRARVGRSHCVAVAGCVSHPLQCQPDREYDRDSHGRSNRRRHDCAVDR